MAEALRRLSPGEEVLVSDLVSEVQPRTAGVLKSLYQVAITHLPWVWSALYRKLAKSDLDPKENAWLRPLLRGLRNQIEHLKPRVIVSTYPLYAGLLDGPEAVTQPLSPTRKTYVHLVRGALCVNGQPLAAGDAALLENESSLALTDAQDAEVLVFDLAA